MATATFLGTGTADGDFTIDGLIYQKPFIVGEPRLQTAFPYPNLEQWRRHALSATSTVARLDGQGRTTVLFAHESGMGSVFFDLTGVQPSVLAGHYNFKRKAILVDRDLAIVFSLKEGAFAELKQQRVPDSHIDMIRKRVESLTFNHRVAGICAAVYMTALLLTQVEATS